MPNSFELYPIFKQSTEIVLRILQPHLGDTFFDQFSVTASTSEIHSLWQGGHYRPHSLSDAACRSPLLGIKSSVSTCNALLVFSLLIFTQWHFHSQNSSKLTCTKTFKALLSITRQRRGYDGYRDTPKNREMTALNAPLTGRFSNACC